MSSIWQAANSGDLATLRRALDEAQRKGPAEFGRELEWQDAVGRTAIIEAAKYNHIGCVKELVKRGANVAHRAIGGTALDYTSHPEIIEVLAQALQSSNNPLPTATISSIPPSTTNLPFYLPTTLAQLDHMLGLTVPPSQQQQQALLQAQIINAMGMGMTQGPQQQQRKMSLGGAGGGNGIRGPCRFWQKGTCRYGETCWFIHEGHPPTSVQQLPRRPDYMMNSQQAHGLRGQSPMSQSQLLPQPLPGRTSSRSVCRYWLQGICNRGPACRFLHGSAAPAAMGAAAAAIDRNGSVTAARPRPRPRSAPFLIQSLPPSFDIQPPQQHHLTMGPPTRFRTFTHPSLVLPAPPPPESLTLNYLDIETKFPVPRPAPLQRMPTQTASEDEMALPFDLDEWDDFDPSAVSRRASGGSSSNGGLLMEDQGGSGMWGLGTAEIEQGVERLLL